MVRIVSALRPPGSPALVPWLHGLAVGLLSLLVGLPYAQRWYPGGMEAEVQTYVPGFGLAGALQHLAVIVLCGLALRPLGKGQQEPCASGPVQRTEA